MARGRDEDEVCDRKAMRGRFALLRHFVRNAEERLLCFAKAFGVRARPRAALARL